MKRLKVVEAEILCCLVLKKIGPLFLEDLVTEVNKPTNQEGKNHSFKYSQETILKAMDALIKRNQVFTNKHIHPITKEWTIKYNLVKEPTYIDLDE